VETIANTTVLSNFACVGRLDLLQRLLDHLYISGEVYEEIQDGLEAGYEFYEGIDEFIYPFVETGWLRLVSMEEAEFRHFRELPAQLHAGEASCLAIAYERGWALLTDDQRARKAARKLRVELSGTLGILVRAVEAGLIALDEGDILLQKMIERGYRSPYGSLRLLLENE